MPQHFLHAFVLLIGTTFIHLGCTAAVLGWLGSVKRHDWVMRNSLTRASVLATLVLLMTSAAYLESVLWAVSYRMADALPSFQEALYFSLVTFTTLGYGDITLGEEWRMLGALQAANGILMFGWTTALIVAVAQRVYSLHGHEDA
jgi:hypothetical protein